MRRPRSEAELRTLERGLEAAAALVDRISPLKVSGVMRDVLVVARAVRTVRRGGTGVRETPVKGRFGP